MPRGGIAAWPRLNMTSHCLARIGLLIGGFPSLARAYLSG
jgi:hypothetical protein